MRVFKSLTILNLGLFSIHLSFFSDAKHFEGRRSITYISDSRLVYILYFHRNLLISLER